MATKLIDLTDEELEARVETLEALVDSELPPVQLDPQYDIDPDIDVKRLEFEAHKAKEGLTNAEWKRRVSNGLHYINSSTPVEMDEYSFFFANLNEYSEETKARLLPRISQFRDLLVSLCSTIESESTSNS